MFLEIASRQVSKSLHLRQDPKLKMQLQSVTLKAQTHLHPSLWKGKGTARKRIRIQNRVLCTESGSLLHQLKDKCIEFCVC